MNENIKLLEFLNISRAVTDNYILAKGEWSKTDQWSKIREEEKEFRDAIKPDNELEEFWDCFFAKLTLLHLEKFNDKQILESAISTWNKIHNRSLLIVQQTKVTEGTPT